MCNRHSENMTMELMDMGDPVLGKVVQRRPLEKLTLELRCSGRGSASGAGKGISCRGNRKWYT